MPVAHIPGGLPTGLAHSFDNPTWLIYHFRSEDLDIEKF